MSRLSVHLSGTLGTFTLDVAFDASVRAVTALFGASGSGKTTVLRCLAGLVRLPGSRLVVDGDVWQDETTFLPPHRRPVGYVFQEPSLFPHLTVRANLTYGTRRRAAAPGIGFDKVVDILGLGSMLERHPDRLSGGEAQRVAIGRAVLAHPRLLLMDEPLASLDAPRKAEILPLVERLRDEAGIPILYVSHAIEEVIRLADTLVLLSEGRVAAVGGVEELMCRLDLHPVTGRHEAGAVISARVVAHDAEFGLTALAFGPHILRVARLDLEEGRSLRVRIRARDVTIAMERPVRTSVLNVFPGRVARIEDSQAPQVDVLLDIGAPLIARITRRSLVDLDLKEGMAVHALVKAVAIDRHSLGRAGASRED
ncbi:MAG: molybdenum ABC transporter ATP-binding protein [Magnetospirillum sp. WYHS-4]